MFSSSPDPKKKNVFSSMLSQAYSKIAGFVFKTYELECVLFLFYKLLVLTVSLMHIAEKSS